jgi:hypothetical protein
MQGERLYRESRVLNFIGETKTLDSGWNHAGMTAKIDVLSSYHKFPIFNLQFAIAARGRVMVLSRHDLARCGTTEAH